MFSKNISTSNAKFAIYFVIVYFTTYKTTFVVEDIDDNLYTDKYLYTVNKTLVPDVNLIINNTTLRVVKIKN